MLRLFYKSLQSLTWQNRVRIAIEKAVMPKLALLPMRNRVEAFPLARVFLLD